MLLSRYRLHLVPIGWLLLLTVVCINANFTLPCERRKRDVIHVQVNPPAPVPLPIPLNPVQQIQVPPMSSAMNRISTPVQPGFSWNSLLNNIKGMFSHSTQMPLFAPSIQHPASFSFVNQPASNMQMMAPSIPGSQTVMNPLSQGFVSSPNVDNTLQFLINQQTGQISLAPPPGSGIVTPPPAHKSYILAAPFTVAPEILKNMMKETDHIKDAKEKIFAIRKLLLQYKSLNGTTVDSSKDKPVGRTNVLRGDGSVQFEITPELMQLLNKLPDQQSKFKLLRLMNQKQQEPRSFSTPATALTNPAASVREIDSGKSAAGIKPDQATQIAQLLKKLPNLVKGLGERNPNLANLLKGRTIPETDSLNDESSKPVKTIVVKPGSHIMISTDPPPNMLHDSGGSAISSEARKASLRQHQQQKGIENLRAQLSALSQQQLDQTQSLIHFMVAHPGFISRLMTEDIPENIKDVLRTVQVLKFPETLLSEDNKARTADPALSYELDNEKKHYFTFKPRPEFPSSTFSSYKELKADMEKKLPRNFHHTDHEFQPLVYWLPRTGKAMRHGLTGKEGSIMVGPSEDEKMRMYRGKQKDTSLYRTFIPPVQSPVTEFFHAYTRSPTPIRAMEMKPDVNDYTLNNRPKNHPIAEPYKIGEPSAKQSNWKNVDVQSVLKEIYVGESEPTRSAEAAFGAKLDSAKKQLNNEFRAPSYRDKEPRRPDFHDQENRRPEYDRRSRPPSHAEYKKNYREESQSSELISFRKNQQHYRDDDHHYQNYAPTDYQPDLRHHSNIEDRRLSKPDYESSDMLKAMSTSVSKVHVFDPAKLNFETSSSHPPLFKISLNQETPPPSLPVSAVFSGIHLNNSKLASIVDYLRRGLPAPTVATTSSTTPSSTSPPSYYSLLLPSTISPHVLKMSESSPYFTADGSPSSISPVIYSETQTKNNSLLNSEQVGFKVEVSQPQDKVIPSTTAAPAKDSLFNGWQPITPMSSTTTPYPVITSPSHIEIKSMSNRPYLPTNNSFFINPNNQSFSIHEGQYKPTDWNQKYSFTIPTKRPFAFENAITSTLKDIDQSSPTTTTTTTTTTSTTTTEQSTTTRRSLFPRYRDNTWKMNIKRPTAAHHFGQKLAPKSAALVSDQSDPMIASDGAYSEYVVTPDQVFYSRITEPSETEQTAFNTESYMHWKPIISDRETNPREMEATSASEMFRPKPKENDVYNRNVVTHTEITTKPCTTTTSSLDAPYSPQRTQSSFTDIADGSVAESQIFPVVTPYPLGLHALSNPSQHQITGKLRSAVKIDHPFSEIWNSRSQGLKSVISQLKDFKAKSKIPKWDNMENTSTTLTPSSNFQNNWNFRPDSQAAALKQEIIASQTPVHMQATNQMFKSLLPTATFDTDYSQLKEVIGLKHADSNQLGVLHNYHLQPSEMKQSSLYGQQPPVKTTEKPSSHLLSALWKVPGLGSLLSRFTNVTTTTAKPTQATTVSSTQMNIDPWEVLINAIHKKHNMQITEKERKPDIVVDMNSDVNHTSKNLEMKSAPQLSSTPIPFGSRTVVTTTKTSNEKESTRKSSQSRENLPKKKESGNSQTSIPIRKIKLRWFGDKDAQKNSTSVKKLNA